MLGFVCYVSQIWHNRIMWFCRLFNLYYLNLLVFVYVENFSLGPFNNYVTHKFPILQGFQFQDFSQQLYLLCNRIRCHPKTFIPFLASANHKGPLVVIWQQFEVVLLFQQRFSSISNVSLLSTLLSICLHDWRCIDIILIVPKYIPQIEHIRFFKFFLTAGLNASWDS